MSRSSRGSRRPEQPAGTERDLQAGRSAGPGDRDRPARPAGPSKSDRPARSAGPGKSDRPARSERPDTAEASAGKSQKPASKRKRRKARKIENFRKGETENDNGYFISLKGGRLRQIDADKQVKRIS